MRPGISKTDIFLHTLKSRAKSSHICSMVLIVMSSGLCYLEVSLIFKKTIYCEVGWTLNDSLSHIPIRDGLQSWLTYQRWTVELTDLSVMDCRVDWLIRDELWSGLTYQLLTVELTNLSVMDCGDDWPISYWLWSGLPPCILGLTTQVSIQILILIDCWQKTRNFLPHNVWYALTIYTLDLKS